MSDRTLTALYASKDDAERARDQLIAAGIGSGHIDIHNEGSTGGSTTGPLGATAGGAVDKAATETKGFFSKIGDFFGGHEDSHVYAEGVRRGNYLLTAKVDDAQADVAARTLEGSNALDFDKTHEEFRGSGWTGGASAPGREGYTAALDTGAAGLAGATTTDRTYAERDMSARDLNRDDKIQLVEEQIRVGKREVERGGVRVRSYVVETPVHEQIGLREEHVTIERRPVNEATTNADALLRDRTIEMTETAEEAVVAKNAVVREELTIRKDVTERTEEIHDSVRRTEVEVDDQRGEKQAGTTTATETVTTPRRV